MIKLCSSLEKVFHEKEPVGYSIKDIYLLKDERYSFQLAFYLQDKMNLIIDTDLNVEVRYVKEVDCKRPVHYKCDNDYLFTTPKKAPDLLSRNLQYDCNCWNSFFIDLYGTKAGDHQVMIQIGEENICFQVHVIGVSLQPLRIPFTQWFHVDAIVDYYKVEFLDERFWELLENSIHHYVKRGHNMILTPIITPPLDTAIGKERTNVQLIDISLDENGYHFDYANLERYIQLCQKEGIQYFEMSHLFSQWGAKCAPNIYINDKLYFGWHTPSNDLEFLEFLKLFIVSLKEELKQLGIFDVCYFHLSDEPDLQSMEYVEARKAIDEVIQDCCMIEALRDYDYFEKGYVDIPVCSTRYIQPFLDHRPEKLWCYYCCAENVDLPNHFISLPGYRTRVTGLLLYYYDLNGFLHWGYNFYNGLDSISHIDPYETVDGNNGYPSGDPFIVYPSKNGIDVDSMRSMILEDAFNDYRAFKQLEDKIGRKEVIQLIEERFTDLNFTHYPKEDSFYLELRNEVNKRLGE